ncbi:MAG: phosphoribosylamine--glycine ligase [Phycisphaerales bacterium]|nr:phosphoribosylamine--glycine ligase [Planctomycetota bacterium]MCH8507735.1 phosphoribosylamine--glycine ligase [Phycisphaerales bacterium]
MTDATGLTGSKLNVLLIGGGGREHALAEAMSRSPLLDTLYITHPSNPGLAALGTPVDVPVSGKELYRLQQFCDRKNIGLVVIGPEDPLAEGYADALRKKSDGSVRPVFGPGKAGAMLESDKAFAKQMMRSASVPTGEGRVFTDPNAAKHYLVAVARDDEEVSGLIEGLDRIQDQSARYHALAALVRVGTAATHGGTVGAPDLSLLKDAGIGRDRADTVALAKRIAAAWDAPRKSLPVIKACGLAKGKGVILPATLREAFDAIDDMMVRKVFGDAGKKVIVEERLQGTEVSILALLDGRNILILPPCQDHKRLGEGDTGPNTGGMGAFCPADTVDEAVMRTVETDVFVAIADALRREEIDFRGVLYAGLMLTPGGPKVLEFNTRFGDPECQPLMARLESDAIELFLATAEGRLDEVDVRFSEQHAVCVVLASPGYPADPKTGGEIVGIDKAQEVDGVRVYHAGTRSEGGTLVTAGGRVLGVTALAPDFATARAHAYRACDRIRFDGMQYRRDIGAGVSATARA